MFNTFLRRIIDGFLIVMLVLAMFLFAMGAALLLYAFVGIILQR